MVLKSIEDFIIGQLMRCYKIKKRRLNKMREVIEVVELRDVLRITNLVR